MANPASNDANEVNRVALKLPQFWDKEADLWFINIEAQFILANITRDITKYYAVVSALNSDILTYVSDIVKNPPTVNLYDTLKKRLITEFSDSEQKRIKNLLSNAVLGDDKPSHLLRKMKQLAQDKVGDEFLKTLWIQRLPNAIQPIISVSEGNLDKLGQIADKIVDLTPQQVDETQFNTDHKGENNTLRDLQAQIASLTEQVQRLSRGRQREFGDNRNRRQASNHRRRSKTPNRQREKWCWYHDKFGDKANKCVPPCEYNNNSGN